MKYYTRSEAARELEVSPQGIGKRLKATGAIARCKKSGNKLLIPGEVMEELRAHYMGETETNGNSETETETPTETNGNSETETETETETNGNSETETETPTELDIVWEAYRELKKQLEVKDEQIKVLNEALLNAQQQGKAAQLLQAADKRDQLLSSGEDEANEDEPKSRWQRLKEAWRG